MFKEGLSVTANSCVREAQFTLETIFSGLFLRYLEQYLNMF